MADRPPTPAEAAEHVAAIDAIFAGDTPMLDRAMQQFSDEMRARPRPRRSSTRRADIDCSSAPGAAELGRRIQAFWNAAGYDIQIEVVRAGGPRVSPVFGIRSDMIGARSRPQGGANGLAL
jgi:hypothetical protein